MSAISEMKSTVARGIVELRRPGEGDLPGRALWRMGQVVVTLVIVGTNLVGACAVLGLANFVVPLPALAHAPHVRLVNALVAVSYLAIAIPLGVIVGTWRLLGLKSWLVQDRAATLTESRIVLYAPLRLFALQVSLWLCAALLFGLLNLSFSSRLGLRVAIVVLITGLVTAACAYLLTERILRPAAARALADAPPERLAVPGVATRAVLAWMLGTGLTVFGVVAIGILALAGDPTVNVHRLGVSMVVLGGVGIPTGFAKRSGPTSIRRWPRTSSRRGPTWRASRSK